MTGVVPKDSATPRSIVVKHSSQIPSKTFAMETNMTQAQLYQWNPVLGDGDNEQKKRNEDKTYSSRDSHVVTHRSTNLPFNCLCMAERTGCPVFS
ncbi:hypothetical protein KCU77_g6235, partial [Aureobasidium melanogenum]